MSRIHLLDAATSNAIAAGEVIERPMSIVKELMENSIDAGATQITIEIQDGGITLIRVRDNGCGMDEEDAKNAFICHATSKITTLDELFSLHSMGFRGEALASIAAASRVTLSTKEPLAEKGTCVRYEAGKFISCDPIGMPSGTTVEVRDLFYNLPARFKFLKKDQTEANYIQVLIERFILCHTDVSFKFIKNGKTVLQSPGNCDASSALYSVYGKDIVSACRPIEYNVDGITVKGFAGLPRISRASRSEQIFFVNQRLIRSKTITSAVDSAYTNMLMKGKYAFVILDIYMPSQDLDVNVHPQKAEVRFSNESAIYRAVYHALSSTLATESMSIDYSFPSSGKEPVSAPVASAPQSHVAAPATAPVPAPIPAPTPVVKTPEIKKPDSAIKVPFSTIPFDEPSPAIAYENKETLSEPAPSYVVTPDEPKAPELTQPQIPETLIQTREESLHELMAARVIGTFCDTYILMESTDRTLLMVDQHAAHEKVLYEKLVAQEAEKKIVSQPLLSPAIVSMSRSDISFIEEHSEELENLGFEISSLGDSEMAIRSVPAQIDPNSVSSAFIEMVDEWMHQSKTRKDALILSLATCACKAAVKGHDKLHDIEIKGLLEDLSKLKDPYHCPHGRPILIRISEKEIEKQFKRIV
ncbi:MAG: DNA mismatch repair endonuclease MutL [Clostridiales bacterium]|nr:DNA mismatch repair endonuclease MutL [Clostridiales bacterium]